MSPIWHRVELSGHSGSIIQTRAQAYTYKVCSRDARVPPSNAVQVRDNPETEVCN